MSKHEEDDTTYNQVKKIYLEINNQFKGHILRRRSDFVDLLVKTISNSEESVKSGTEMFKRFGTRIVAETNPANAITILVDGEVVMKK